MSAYTLDYTPNTDQFAVMAPTEVRGALAAIPAGTWSIEHPCYFPATRENVLALEALGSPTATTFRFKSKRDALLAVDPLVALETAVALSTHGTLSSPLLSHQLDFVTRHQSSPAVLNASEQGTGKTRAALALLTLWGVKRTIVALPKSLARQWMLEWEAMWEEAPPHRFFDLTEGTVKYRDASLRDLPDIDPAIVLVNYEVLGPLEKAIQRFRPDAFIADESWRLKNRTANVTRVATRIAQGVRSRPQGHVALLTGTPIGNHVGDLWSQLRVLSPDLVPENYWQFAGRFAHIQTVAQVGGRRIEAVTGVKDPVGLMLRLTPVWERATKATCLSLPPKVASRVAVPLTPAQTQLYRQVYKAGEQALGHAMSLAGALTTLLRLQEISGGFTPYWDGAVVQVKPAPCGKAAWLGRFAVDRLAGDPTIRVIVWCRFNHEVARLVEELGQILGEAKVVGVTGETLGTELTRIKASFNSRSEDGVQVIVAQIKKLAFGHNLQAADFLIYFSHTWSYVERAQSEDRAHRQGRQNAVQIVDLVCEGTLDEGILHAVQAKKDLAVQLSPATAGKLVELDAN